MTTFAWVALHGPRYRRQVRRESFFLTVKAAVVGTIFQRLQRMALSTLDQSFSIPWLRQKASCPALGLCTKDAKNTELHMRNTRKQRRQPWPKVSGRQKKSCHACFVRITKRWLKNFERSLKNYNFFNAPFIPDSLGKKTYWTVGRCWEKTHPSQAYCLSEKFCFFCSTKLPSTSALAKVTE